MGSLRRYVMGNKSLKQIVQDMEKDAIARSVVEHAGNVSAAAKDLGVPAASMWRKVRRYGIEVRVGIYVDGKKVGGNG
jgi:transcriptional regulator of acetoin/glycerol metabolism